MGIAVQLRSDFTADDLRSLARNSDDLVLTRRLLSLAEIYDGGARGRASRVGGVGLQTIRDWVLRFNAGGPDGLVDKKPPGAVSRLNDDHRQALAAAVERGPLPAVDGVVRWRLSDLAQWAWEEFGVSVSRQTIGRELHGLGYVKLSARPRHHAQEPGAIPAFKKTSPPGGGNPRRSPARHEYRNLVPGRSPDRPEEQDHKTMGEKGNASPDPQGLTHEISLYLWRHLSGPGRWRGPRPATPQHRRHEPSFEGDIHSRRSPSSCHRHRRSGRMALLKNPGDAEQHNFATATVKITRTQPGRKHLAVHARQLALKPCLQLLQRYCRSLLFRLEPTHRSAMENYVHRPSRLGP